MFGFGYIKLFFRRKKWRKLNQNNETFIVNDFRFEKVKVGIGTYGNLDVTDCGPENSAELYIGNYCSIASHVKFLLSGEHTLNTISTFPFKARSLENSVGREAGDKGNIIIDDDVWIGTGATICSGVHIEQGAVIAAGAVVTKDVSPYEVVGGVPVKVIKKRFKDEMIAELMKVDYEKLTDELIRKHIDDLYKPLEDFSQLVWIPQKLS